MSSQVRERVSFPACAPRARRGLPLGLSIGEVNCGAAGGSGALDCRVLLLYCVAAEQARLRTLEAEWPGRGKNRGQCDARIARNQYCRKGQRGAGKFVEPSRIGI